MSEVDPFTDSLKDLDALKTARKLLRLDRISRDEVDVLYRRVQATPGKYYYSQFRLKEWREVIDSLTGESKDRGSPLFAGVLKGLIQRFLKEPATTERGLGLLASLARVSGHIGMNLVDVYRKLATKFDFKLIVTPGAERFAGAPNVQHNTFIVGVTDDRAIRVRLVTEQVGTGANMSRQQADDAHDQLTTRFYYHERYGRGGLNQRIEDLRRANEGNYEPPSDPDGDSRLVEWNSTYGYPIGLQTSALRNPILRAALVRPEHQEAYNHTNGEYRRRHWQQRAQVGSERNRARALMRERQGDAATNLGLTVAQWGVRPSESGVDAFQGSAVQRELEGGAATLQSLLNKAYAPMKAPRRKAAPMSHRGASANQTSYALSGRPPPLPGMHEMSDGTIMAD